MAEKPGPGDPIFFYPDSDAPQPMTRERMDEITGKITQVMEWQFSAGGGKIVESDRTISVNNPAAIRAWQRARHWVGWISPPSVVAYQNAIP